MAVFPYICNRSVLVGGWVSERGGGGTCLTWSTKDFTEGSSKALFSVANFSLDGDNATSAGYPYLHMQQEGADDAT